MLFFYCKMLDVNVYNIRSMTNVCLFDFQSFFLSLSHFECFLIILYYLQQMFFFSFPLLCKTSQDILFSPYYAIVHQTLTGTQTRKKKFNFIAIILINYDGCFFCDHLVFLCKNRLPFCFNYHHFFGYSSISSCWLMFHLLKRSTFFPLSLRV